MQNPPKCTYGSNGIFERSSVIQSIIFSPASEAFFFSQSFLITFSHSVYNGSVCVYVCVHTYVYLI